MEKSKDKSPMIQSFGSEASGKEALKYHYTSPSGLLSILKDGYLRFCDSRFMNDKTEGVFFVKLLLDFMDARRRDFPQVQEALNLLIDKNDFEKIQTLAVDKVNFTRISNYPYKGDRHFLFCTSEAADSLNMWNYYASGGSYEGYNIGFHIERFIKGFETGCDKKLDCFRVLHGRVLYSKQKQFDEIEVFLKELEQKASASKIALIALELRRYIDAQGIFYKHNSFADEKEYRIVINIDDSHIPRKKGDGEKYFGENNKNLQEDFYDKNGLLVPFLKVTIPKDAIARIYTSPTTEHSLAKSSVKELLASRDFENVDVFKSYVPIRF